MDGHNCGIFTFWFLYNCFRENFFTTASESCSKKLITVQPLSNDDLYKIRKTMAIIFFTKMNSVQNQSLVRIFKVMCQKYSVKEKIQEDIFDLVYCKKQKWNK